MGDGHWTDRRDDKDVRSSSMRIGPVFYGEATYAGGDGWKCSLDGEAMGAYSTLAGAKARIDWEVWNRLRQTQEGYKVLMARKSDWQDGGNKYRSPEYPTAAAAGNVKNREPGLIEPAKS